MAAESTKSIGSLFPDRHPICHRIRPHLFYILEILGYTDPRVSHRGDLRFDRRVSLQVPIENLLEYGISIRFEFQ
jgi:hypothetical protein